MTTEITVPAWTIFALALILLVCYEVLYWALTIMLERRRSRKKAQFQDVWGKYGW